MNPLDLLGAELLSHYRARTPRSESLYQRAARVLPGGDTRSGTFHLPYPLFIQKGRDCRLWDADGNEYVDFLGNFTSMIHGHVHPVIQAAISAQAALSTVHGSANELQIALAESLQSRVPSVERVRFCNSGTEATMGALRAAKAFTGKPKIMKMEGGYHGSHDQVSVAMAPPYDAGARNGLSPGAVSEVLLGSFNDLSYTAALIRKHRDELAAVIVEPMLGAAGAIPAEPGFLAGLREVTRECDVIFILDEIITFRLGYGGAQEQFGVAPDLTTFAKIIGGGLPIGAFGGRADIMAGYDPTRPGSITHSGTYNGNAVTMAAGIAALQLLSRDVIEEINRRGDALRAALNGLIARHGLPAAVVGMGSLMQLHFVARPPRNARDAAAGDARLLRLLHLALLTSGVFVPARQMYVLSTAMSDATIGAFHDRVDEALGRIAGARAGSPLASATKGMP